LGSPESAGFRQIETPAEERRHGEHEGPGHIEQAQTHRRLPGRRTSALRIRQISGFKRRILESKIDAGPKSQPEANFVHLRQKFSFPI
jgi:hypothetical protein